QVFKSTNGGQSWTAGLIIASTGHGGGPVGRTDLYPFRESIAISKNYVYVVASGCDGLDAKPNGLFYADTGSGPGSFNTISLTAYDPFSPGAVSYGQGDFDNVLYVDPADPCNAYVGGVWLQRYPNPSFVCDVSDPFTRLSTPSEIAD